MKILFVASLYYPYIKGGAEIVLQRQAELLALRGHSVAVYTLGETDSTVRHNNVLVERRKINNIFFHGSEKQGSLKRFFWHWADIYNPLAESVLSEFLSKNIFDIAIFHNLPGVSVAGWSAVEKLSLPWMQVLHDQYLMCPRSTMFNGRSRCVRQCKQCAVMRIAHPSLSRKVPAVVGVSSFILNKHLSHGYFGKNTRSYAVHNVALPGGDKAPSTRRCEDVTFAFVGTVTANKGVEDILSAFCSSSIKGAKLLIAGRGSSDYVEALKHEYASPNVHFLGYVDGHALMNEIDCLIVPSVWEDTLPSVVFESLVVGTPVLGSLVGGIPEMIHAGENGHFFEPGDVAGLRRLMDAFVDNVSFWRGRRSEIAAAAESYTDTEGWLSKWEDIIEKEIRLQRPLYE